MIIRISLEQSGVSIKLLRSQFNDLKREAFRELGGYWHAKMRPKHFTVAGAREYGYTARSGEGQSGKRFWRSYTGRKKKKHGHQQPLVWSGESKAQTEQLDVRATSKGARVVLHARKLNWRNRFSKIRMADEMTTVSEREEADLTRQMQRFLDRGVAQARLDKVQGRL